MFVGCTVTQYSGEIYPTTVQFDKANFKYIKTIKGGSEATYEYGGWDKSKSDGLVNEAKTNMYEQHPLQENQVPTNITVDILREGVPNYQSKSIELRKIRVVITADIFEFSNNGVYNPTTTNIKNDNSSNINDNGSVKTKSKVIKVGDLVYFEDFKEGKLECKVLQILSKNKFEIEYLNKKKIKEVKKAHIDYLFYKNEFGEYTKFDW